MDFRHQIVTCLFSMLRLSFETQKIKENYAIFIHKVRGFTHEMPGVCSSNARHLLCKRQGSPSASTIVCT